MVIDGTTQKRIVLTANAETIITFPDIQDISFMVDGGTVYLKVNGTITDNTDLTAIYVKDSCSLDVHKKQPIYEIHVYTLSSNVTLQWMLA